MRIVFLVFLAVHGIIHLAGFIKSFGFAEVEQLKVDIPRPIGMMWLAAFFVLALTAFLFAFKWGLWWIPGFAGLIVSQVLIIFSWQDARFGTIANLVILVACVIGYGSWSFHQRYQKDVLSAIAHETISDTTLLTEKDILHLPEPVKKYIRYSGSIGKPKIHNFRIRFKGKIRKDETSGWMNFDSEQYNFMHKPTRLFFMNAVMKGLPVAGYHCYLNGDAFMDIRLLSLFKVQYAEGDEMDVAETVTFFNDMCCMAPATLIDSRIKWLGTEGNTVKASFTNNLITISATLFFNDLGELINFTSGDRYAADAGKKLPWATPLKNYRSFDGYRLAAEAETIYSYPEKELCYGTFSLESIEYNCRDLK